jgi:lipopolysaccharide export system protein LptA
MRHLRLLAAAALISAAGAARAQGIDMTKGGPVEVTSDNGMEWHQTDQIIMAKGNAKAVRGTVTVTADVLTAHYRRKAVAGAATPPPPPAGSATSDTGNDEIYRLEAEGHVHIYTATDQAFGDHAVYDIDQAVLVMTGHDLHIITPNQTMSARDVMEYWSQKHMSVGRGDAVVITNDGRRVSADVLVGYTVDPNAPPGTPPVQKVAAQQPAKPAKPGSDPLADAGGKLQRVDAFGHVEVRTATEIMHGDKGVYIPDTGIARLSGNVHLTRGQNQLNGDEGVTNLKTGISTVTRNPGSRVEGLVVPNDANSAAPGTAVKPKAGTK